MKKASHNRPSGQWASHRTSSIWTAKSQYWTLYTLTLL